MFRTQKVGTRTLASIATIATLTGVSLPLLATAASAATTAVTVNAADKTANNKAVAYQGTGPDTTHTVTGTLTNDAGGASPTRFLIASGPNADLLNNGAAAADGTCTNGTATTFSCGYTSGAGKTGVDTIRVFADVNNNQLFDSGEPSDTATKTWSGAPFTVSMTPNADTAATGTCNPFTVVVTDQGGNPVVAGTRVDVTVSQTSPAPATTASTAAFCDPTLNGGPGGTNSEAAPATATTTVIAPTGVSGEYVTDDAGTVTFGISSTTASTHTVLAFVETTSNNALDAGEPNDTSTKTFTTGGAAGVSSLDAEPETATRFIGSVHTFTALVKNATGDTVSGVTPLADITAGPNAAVTPTCGASNQAGVSTCTYTAGTTTGTDTIIVWVQQSNAGSTPGPDASEPQDTIQATFVAGAAGTAIDLVCTGTAAGGTAAVTTPAPGTDVPAEETCVSPTSRSTETFTAYVTVPDGPDAGTAPDAAPGVPVNFSLASGGATTADATLSATTVVTDAAGKATVTVTNPNPTIADTYSVTASTATNTGTVTDTATEAYAARTTTSVAVTPASATNQVNTQHTVTGTVKDQFGDPIANQAITFNVTGRNTRTSTALVTGGTGTQTFSYTDTGSASSGGTDSITATSGSVTSSAATKFWITEAAVPGQVILDVDPAAGTGGACETAAPEKSLSAALATSNVVCATVRTTSGNNVLAGQSVTFTITGVGTFANGTKTFTTTANGSGQATATATSTASGAQSIKVAAGTVSDTGTITYATPAVTDARFIDLKPEGGPIAAGQAKELTALVTDQYGNPVPGVTVNFTETGAGSFSSGTSSASGVTGTTGTVSVTLTSAAGSTGTESVTATIGSPSTQCTQPAVTGPPAVAAGNCSDTEDYTFQSGVAPTISVSPTALNVGQYATVVVHGTAGQAVQLLAYSRPSTTYIVVRNGTIGSNGTTTFSVGPRTNTRLFAKTASGSSTSAVISVRPAESLFGKATGKVGSFHGGIVPGHAGVTVRLFTVKNGVRSSSPVGTATTDVNGKWTYSRTFAAHGPVTFISQTLSDLTNLAGQSNRVTITFS